MLYETYKLLNNNDYIRKMYQYKYEHILCDEQNDTTMIQYELVRILGLKAKSVMLIGDEMQNVYSFMGADSRYMTECFINDFNNVKIINSNINYRCQSKVVDVFNDLVKNYKIEKSKYYSPTKAFKKPGDNVIFNVFNNDKEEAKYISKEIKNLVSKNNYNYGDIMILYRCNSQSRALEEMFNKNEIPYSLQTGISFYNKPEIKDMICYLKLINNTDDNEAFSRVINRPTRYLGNVFLDEVFEYAKKNNKSLYQSMLEFPRRNEWRYRTHIENFENMIHKIQKTVGRYKVSTIIEHLRKELNYDVFISNKGSNGQLDDNKIDNIISFQNQASEYKDLGEFLTVVNRLACSDDDRSKARFGGKKNAVDLRTCHSSKGLESKVVFVIGFSQGLMPHGMNGNIRSELNLAYVALSRAEEKMYISSILNYGDKELGVSDFAYCIFDEESIEKKINKCTGDKGEDSMNGNRNSNKNSKVKLK